MFKSKERAAEYARDYYHKHRERDLERRRNHSRIYNKEWRYQNPEKKILYAAKSRAKRSGLDFDLELNDIMIPEVCPILDIPLEWSLGVQTSNTPALDRIDNSKGYIKGNIRVISHKANRHKADLSLDDIERLYNYSKENF